MLVRLWRLAVAQVDPAYESAPDLASAPAFSRRRFNPSGWLDLQGWIQLVAGPVIGRPRDRPDLSAHVL